MIAFPPSSPFGEEAIERRMFLKFNISPIIVI